MTPITGSTGAPAALGLAAAVHAPATPWAMDTIQVVLLVLVAAGASLVVHTRNPIRQVVVLSGYGLLLALLFLAMQAPDVTLSALTVGAVALPFLLLLAIAKIRRLAGVGKGVDEGD